MVRAESYLAHPCAEIPLPGVKRQAGGGNRRRRRAKSSGLFTPRRRTSSATGARASGRRAQRGIEAQEESAEVRGRQGRSRRSPMSTRQPPSTTWTLRDLLARAVPRKCATSTTTLRVLPNPPLPQPSRSLIAHPSADGQRAGSAIEVHTFALPTKAVSSPSSGPPFAMS